MPEPLWEVIEGDSPLVAAAIHNGHNVRAEVATQLAVSEADRLREEDPYTGIWTDLADTRIVGLTSRFEMDLNRPQDTGVYIYPEHAWGLAVWKQEPSAELVSRSLRQHRDFFWTVGEVFSRLRERHGRFIVLDLHTYNHRRAGRDEPPADPEANPEVNLGTGTMNRSRWSPLVDRFLSDLRHFDFDGRPLDVRENVKFRGGYFPRWIHERFPESGCALAIEVKKFFMDEWTGELNRTLFETIHRALRATVPGLLESLKAVSLRS